MGFVIVVALGLYLLVSMGVVAWAISYAKKHGKSAKRWGWGSALVMYLLVFWDWIPTIATHQYYCATEAGFWVYKTPEQWKQENPGVMETLVSYNKNSSGFNVNWPAEHKQHSDGHQKELREHINKRFDTQVIWEDVLNILPIIKKERVFLDTKNNEELARYIDFGSGNSVKNAVGPPGPIKFWLISRTCVGGKEREIKFGNFYIQFEGTEK